MRALRWILAVLAVLAVLLVVAVFAVTRLVNPDDYRAEAQRLVSRYAGSPFVIEGHVRLTWFPWLGVRVGAARLASPPDQPGPDLIDWRSARLSVRLVPLLLHRRVEIGTIELDGADIHLRRDPNGRANWQGLLARSPPGAAPSSSPSVPVVGGLILRDATLHYSQPGLGVDLTHWQLHVSAWRPGSTLAVSTRFVAQGAELPATGVPVAFAVRGVRVQATPLSISAPTISLQIAAAVLRGAARLDDAATGPEGEGSLSLHVPSVRGLIGELGIKARLPKDPGALGALSLSGRWRLHGGTFAIQPLSARLDATRLAGWLRRSAGPEALWTFALSADEIDFGRYLPPTRKHPKPFTLPLAQLRSLHARGTLTIARATIAGATMRDVRLAVE